MRSCRWQEPTYLYRRDSKSRCNTGNETRCKNIKSMYCFSSYFFPFLTRCSSSFRMTHISHYSVRSFRITKGTGFAMNWKRSHKLRKMMLLCSTAATGFGTVEKGICLVGQNEESVSTFAFITSSFLPILLGGDNNEQTHHQTRLHSHIQSPSSTSTSSPLFNQLIISIFHHHQLILLINTPPSHSSHLIWSTFHHCIINRAIWSTIHSFVPSFISSFIVL